MSAMLAILFNVGAVVLLLGGLIFVHELGHFIAAKLLGVKVLKFSIGLGPRLAGFRRGETEYVVAAVPFGGFVKMADADPETGIRPEDRGRTFLEQRPWKRLVIAFAGPAMNLVFPVMVYFAHGLAREGTLVPGSTIGQVSPGSPAQAAGLRPGDRIAAVQPPGEPATETRYFEDLSALVSPHPGEPVAFTVARGAETLHLVITPAPERDDSSGVERRTRGLIGVSPEYPSALVVPAPGAVGRVEPFDLVTAVDGRPVAQGVALTAALDAAACRPVTLAVTRGGEARELAGVPSCAPGGGPSLLLADPTVRAAVAAVEPGSPAAEAGLARGDVIVAVGARAVHGYRDLNAVAASLAPGAAVRVGLLGGRELTLVPGGRAVRDELTGEKREVPVLGFQLHDLKGIDRRALLAEQVPLHRGVAWVAADAVDKTREVVRITALGIGKIVTGEFSLRTVGGPITLFRLASQAADDGLATFLIVMAIISVNLGLMNLLPIPVLDGGHIVTALIEGAIRRPISLRAREIANVVGLLLLVTLMVVALGNDILRFQG
jgi:regulator of sigma E protease